MLNNAGSFRVTPQRFTSYVACDLGASDPKGHLRLELFSDEARSTPMPPVAQYDGVLSEQGFTQQQDVVQSFARQIASLFKQQKQQLKEPLTAVVVAIPGPVKGLGIPLLINLKDASGQPLRELDFTPLKEALQQQGVDVSPTFKPILVNDMAGGAASAVAQLKASDFKAGDHIAYMMMGGGFGVAEITHKGSHIELLTGEAGHQKSAAFNGTLEATGVSVPAVLNNFTAGVNQAGYTGGLPAGFTTKELASFQVAHSVLPQLTAAQYEQGTKKAVSALLNNLTEAMDSQLLRGCNQVILAGGLNQMAQTIVEGHPQWFQQELAYFKQHLRQEPRFKEQPVYHQVLLALLHQKSSPASESMFKENQFTMRTDIAVASNTEGASELLGASFVGPEKRSNWLNFKA
jgi:hypothetical protein